MKTPELSTDFLQAISAQAVLAAANAESAALDLKGFEGFVLQCHMGAGDSALAYTMTESDTVGGVYTAVNDEAAVPAPVSIGFLATDDDKVKVGYFRTDRRKRFLKVKVAAVGGVSSLVFASVVPVGAQDSGFISQTYLYLL